MSKVTTPEELRRHVSKGKVVSVKDGDGTLWTFEIMSVSIFAWDDSANWMKYMKDDKDGFLKKVEEAVSAPSPSALKAVLARGVKSPKLSYDEKIKDAVPIADLMRRDILVTNLYLEIVNLSFDGILKGEVPDGNPKTVHQGK